MKLTKLTIWLPALRVSHCPRDCIIPTENIKKSSLLRDDNIQLMAIYYSMFLLAKSLLAIHQAIKLLLNAKPCRPNRSRSHLIDYSLENSRNNFPQYQRSIERKLAKQRELIAQFLVELTENCFNRDAASPLWLYVMYLERMEPLKINEE